MADKDFKVKTGLDLPAPLPLSEGGTGQTSAENTRNALMPVQTGHSGKFITTDGTGMSWAVAPQQTATDGAAGYKVYAGNTTPTGQSTGDIWIDASTGNGIQLVRWRKTIASSGSTITGLDDNNLTLSYTAGNEQVYINGTLITRGQDYTATNGTSISLTQSTEVGDTVEIFGNPLFSVTDTYTQAQSNSLYVSKAGFDAAGKNVVINGGFDIWQRGTSFSSIGSNNYFADRWWYGNGGTSNYSITRQVTGDISNLPSIQYCARISRAAGNTNLSQQYLGNVFETVNSIPLVGKTLTLSFYARVGANWSASAGSFSGSIASGNTTDVYLYAGVATNTIAAVYPTLNTTWQKFTATGTMLTSQTQACVYFTWAPTGTAGSADYVEITGVQLEIGSISTPFSRSGGDYQGELNKCQRYYQIIAGGAVDLAFCNGYAINTTQCEGSISFPSMRTTPTLIVATGASYYKFRKAGGDVPLNSVSLALGTPNSGLLFNSTNFTGGTAGAGGVFVTNNTSSSIALQAEI